MEQIYEPHSMKGMVHKNCLEKVVYERKQRNLEQEQKCLLRQHSKDEMEIKHILHRLQHEQHVLTDGDNVEDNEDDAEDLSDHVTGKENRNEEMVNPYPVTIVPKYGPSSHGQDLHLQKYHKGTQDIGIKQSRRKSLEYEDIDNADLQRKGKLQSRNPSLTASFVNKHRISESNRKTSTHSEPGETSETWVGDPEFISSVRRPQKPTSELGQKKFLKRALSEVWSRPNSSGSNMRRGGSLKSRHKRDAVEGKCITEDIDADTKQIPSKGGETTATRKSSVEENKGPVTGLCTTSKHERKRSIKENKSNRESDKQNTGHTEKYHGNEKSISDISHRTPAESSNDRNTEKTTKSVVVKSDNLTVAHNSPVETEVKWTGRTRHGSLKNRKSSDTSETGVKRKSGLRLPVPVTVNVTEAEIDSSNIRRIRSKSVGEPGLSPLSSPLSKDGKFHY